VVVVVTGAGTVVCCVVVVVLPVGFSLSQPLSENRAATATHDRMMVFMFLFVYLFINGHMIAPLVAIGYGV
jgi:hypothetical protein